MNHSFFTRKLPDSQAKNANVSYVLQKQASITKGVKIQFNHLIIRYLPPTPQISCQTRYTLHFIKPLRRSTGLLPTPKGSSKGVPGTFGKGMPFPRNPLDWHGRVLWTEGAKRRRGFGLFRRNPFPKVQGTPLEDAFPSPKDSFGGNPSDWHGATHKHVNM